MRKDLYSDLFQKGQLHFWHKAKREHVLILLTKYLKKKNPKILDAGCGTGDNLLFFKQKGTMYGIDSAKEAILLTRKLGIHHVTQGFIEKTPYKQDSFDCVLALDLLEHTDDKKALSEIQRILKPGGICIITVPAFHFLWSKWDEILGHKRRYTKNELKQTLQAGEFNILYLSYKYSFLLPFVFLIRKIKSKAKKKYSSDFIFVPFLNSILLNMSRIESHFSPPFGTSIICLLQKT